MKLLKIIMQPTTLKNYNFFFFNLKCAEITYVPRFKDLKSTLVVLPSLLATGYLLTVLVPINRHWSLFKAQKHNFSNLNPTPHYGLVIYLIYYLFIIFQVWRNCRVTEMSKSLIIELSAWTSLGLWLLYMLYILKSSLCNFNTLECSY